MLPNQNLRILLVLENFKSLTGSELYVYEAARELLSRHHRVTIVADKIGGEITDRITKKGAQVYTASQKEPVLKTYDVIHTAQPHPTQWALAKFPRQLVVCTIHSQLSMEAPVRDDRIKHYIAVRPDVQAKIIVVDEIPAGQTSVIYNPVDDSRFIEVANIKPKEPTILFVGTLDNIRKQSILSLLKGSHKKIIIVGDKNHMYDGYIETLPAHAEWYPSTWDIENYVAQCTETASVYAGRTAVEGWIAKRSCHVFDIDENGNVQSITLQQPPSWLALYNSRIVVDQLLEVYSRLNQY